MPLAPPLPKIITLRQPWASLVALGLKRVETRGFHLHEAPCPLLIHAGLAEEDMDWAYQSVFLTALHLAGRDESEAEILRLHPFATYGKVLTQVQVGASLTMCSTADFLPGMLELMRPGNVFIEEQTELEILVGNWQPGRVAWTITDNQPLPQPIEWRGIQGLSEAPPDLALRVQEQLANNAVFF